MSSPKTDRLRRLRSCENLADAVPLSKLQASNFKGYRDSTEVEFKPGFNIVTGRNNAGKAIPASSFQADCS